MPKLILLAEDSQEDAESLQAVLSEAGVGNPIVRVSDGDQTIAYLSGEGAFSNRELFPRPQVLLLDLKMPGRDGFQVLEWIRERPDWRELLVVVLSGHRGLAEINRAYELGANSFMFKPPSARDVKDLMKSFREYWTPFFGRVQLDGEMAETW